jgi:hypothetical protein
MRRFRTSSPNTPRQNTASPPPHSCILSQVDLHNNIQQRQPTCERGICAKIREPRDVDVDYGQTNVWTLTMTRDTSCPSHYTSKTCIRPLSLSPHFRHLRPPTPPHLPLPCLPRNPSPPFATWGFVSISAEMGLGPRHRRTWGLGARPSQWAGA